MSIQRDTIPFGPAKIVRDTLSVYSAKEINVVVTTEFADVSPDQYGQGTKTILDQTIEVEFSPQSIWALLASVLPASHINPSIGGRLVTAAPVPTLLHGEDGSLLTIPASAIIGLPDISLGVDKGEFGTMKIGGVTTNGKQLGDAGALYTYAPAGGAYGNPGSPDYLAAGAWSMAWGANILAGDLLEAVTIKPDFKTEAVKAGKRTLDWRHKGCQFAADVVAAIDLEALSDIHNDGATFLYGQRNSTAAEALVFTAATGHTFTLAAASLEKSPMRFAMLEQRQQGVSFRTSSLAGARVSWTTPA
jgi:hypothetical protein